MKPELLHELTEIICNAKDNATLVGAINRAYREGLTDAARVCDGNQLQAIEDSNDVAHNYACKECAQAILAKRDELSSESGGKSKGVASK